MALGNANTSAQSRGKNKPVIVKRRKEVVTARDYNSFLGTASPEGSAACSTSAAVDQTYYHDGAGSVPAVGDLVYSRKRAGSRYFLPAGHYKIGPVSRAYYNIEVNGSGAVAARTTCGK